MRAAQCGGPAADPRDTRVVLRPDLVFRATLCPTVGDCRGDDLLLRASGGAAVLGGGGGLGLQEGRPRGCGWDSRGSRVYFLTQGRDFAEKLIPRASWEHLRCLALP